MKTVAKMNGLNRPSLKDLKDDSRLYQYCIVLLTTKFRMSGKWKISGLKWTKMSLSGLKGQDKNMQK